HVEHGGALAVLGLDGLVRALRQVDRQAAAARTDHPVVDHQLELLRGPGEHRGQRRLVGGDETHLALDAERAALNHVRLLRILERVDQVQLALEREAGRRHVRHQRAARGRAADAEQGAPRGERGHARRGRDRGLRGGRGAPRAPLALVVDEALGVAALAAALAAAAAATAGATAAAAALGAATAAAPTATAAGATALGVVFDGQLGQAGAGVDAGAHVG